jgi:decaprenylphospho-beta-D-erythro-pentofuranosid-2-ulose 2-reductase
MKKILIIGATSAIAEATARFWAIKGHRLYLIARNDERLQAIASDLCVRGAESVHTGLLDLNDFASHENAIEQASKALGGIDIALIAHGTLGDQSACERDFNAALLELNTNAISVISLLTNLANRFELQQQGILAVISSVAGDRGRQSNYVYGTAKGAVTIFLQGLRQRLQASGVHVLTVKPGFIDTPMTKNFKKGMLWSKPEVVANKINEAMEKQRAVIYVPWFWRVIMAVICLIPERMFKFLKM